MNAESPDPEISKLTWVLVGVRPSNPDTPISQEQSQKMLMEAFLPEKLYKLFLCGQEVPDKPATLKEMEDGYFLIRAGLPDYEIGDYCIISSHEEGNLLFAPIEANELDTSNAQDIGGNSFPMWPQSPASA